MRALLRTLVVVNTLTAFLAITPTSTAQEPKKETTGSVSGKVTLGDRPVQRATVLLTLTDRVLGLDRSQPARATTDDEGRYRITGVPAGSYTVAPFTPAFVVPTETSFAQPGKSITLGAGEDVDGIDFSLSRGGVITGRITDADGRPLIEQRINLMRVDERGQRTPGSYMNPFMFSTDDRGIYRVYGLTAGRYKVSVGDAPDSGMVRIGFGGGSYARTFHPDVQDESKATIIDVKPGGESTGIDIKLGHVSKTYVATGRVVDAETGKPMANLQYGHGGVSAQQTNINGFGWTNNRTNANGEFRIEGLSPGRFAAFVVATEQVDFYSEPAVFEVNDSDVSGLEIKVRRGSSISGVAVIEGSDDPEVLAKLNKLEFRALVRSEGLSAPSMTAVPISPDGSFRISGLRAGKVRIVLGGYPPPKGYSLVRVERDGTLQRDGVEVGQGESVSGVRVVIGYGACVLRGEVKVEGGQITPDMRLRVTARRLEGESPMTASSGIDARGRFTIEGLQPGEYEVAVSLMRIAPSVPGAPPPPGVVQPRTLVKQNVTVTSGSEAEVTLVVDLGTKDKESEK